MNFLDGNGVATLTAKLKEKFVSKTELKTLNHESLIGQGNVNGSGQSLIYYYSGTQTITSSSYITLSGSDVAYNDSYSFTGDGKGVKLENYTKYKITVSLNNESDSLIGGVEARLGSTDSTSGADIFAFRLRSLPYTSATRVVLLYISSTYNRLFIRWAVPASSSVPINGLYVNIQKIS